MIWLVVTSQGRRVLGVFGSALVDEAARCAKRTESEAGFPAWVERIERAEGERPKIGDDLSVDVRSRFCVRVVGSVDDYCLTSGDGSPRWEGSRGEAEDRAGKLTATSHTGERYEAVPKEEPPVGRDRVVAWLDGLNESIADACGKAGP